MSCCPIPAPIASCIHDQVELNLTKGFFSFNNLWTPTIHDDSILIETLLGHIAEALNLSYILFKRDEAKHTNAVCKLLQLPADIRKHTKSLNPLLRETLHIVYGPYVVWETTKDSLIFKLQKNPVDSNEYPDFTDLITFDRETNRLHINGLGLPEKADVSEEKKNGEPKKLPRNGAVQVWNKDAPLGLDANDMRIIYLYLDNHLSGGQAVNSHYDKLLKRLEEPGGISKDFYLCWTGDVVYSAYDTGQSLVPLKDVIDLLNSKGYDLDVPVKEIPEKKEFPDKGCILVRGEDAVYPLNNSQIEDIYKAITNTLGLLLNTKDCSLLMNRLEVYARGGNKKKNLYIAWGGYSVYSCFATSRDLQPIVDIIEVLKDNGSLDSPDLSKSKIYETYKQELTTNSYIQALNSESVLSNINPNYLKGSDLGTDTEKLIQSCDDGWAVVEKLRQIKRDLMGRSKSKTQRIRQKKEFKLVNTHKHYNYANSKRTPRHESGAGTILRKGKTFTASRKGHENEPGRRSTRSEKFTGFQRRSF